MLKILCLGYPILGHLWHGCPPLRGLGSLLQALSHPFSFIVGLFWMPSPTIMDEMLWAAAMVASFLILLNLLHFPGKLHYEFLSHALNSIVSSLLAPSCLSALSSKCTTHTAGVLAGWVPFSFHRGKKLIAYGLTCTVSSLATRWFHCLFFLSLPHCPEIIKICLFHWCWLSGRLPFPWAV